MPNEPVEIKLTLDTSGIKRDLDRMKKAHAEAQTAPGGGFKTSLKPGGGSAPGAGSGFGGGVPGGGLNVPAFPSGGGSNGSGSADLPAASQKAIQKLIGSATKKAVETEVKGINWSQILRMYMQNGVRGAAMEGLYQAGGKAAGAIEGAAAGEGAMASVAGAASVAMSAASVVALAAVLTPIIAAKIADDTDNVEILIEVIASKIPGFDKLLEFAKWAENKMSDVDAWIKAKSIATDKTFGLEASRARLGQDLGVAQIGSDWSKLDKIAEVDMRQKRAINADNKRAIVHDLVKSFLAGGK